MLVSFIIIAYNAEKNLKKTLYSLKQQSFPHKDIEVILVDSLSTDNTKKMFERFKEENIDFNRVIILDNQKRILPCGWNIALKQAKGDAILRVDAHSFFNEDFIKNNVSELENGENIVGGKCISVIENNTNIGKLLLIAEESIFGCGIAGFRRKQKREYVDTLAFAMYRKEVFKKVGLYNEKLARTEDNEMHYRMRKAGFKFLLSPTIFTYRYARGSFKDLIKQKYNNGKWIGITLHNCPKCFSLYHFIPLTFVLGIVFSTIMTCLGFKLFMHLIFGAYVTFNLINLVLIALKNKFLISYLLLPFILFILHVSYGIGTIIGFLKGIGAKSND